MPVALMSLEPPGFESIMHSYQTAVQACFDEFFPRRPLNLLVLANCIDREVGRPQGFTRLRGVALIATKSPDVLSRFLEPGCSSPEGHAVADHRKVVSSREEVFFLNTPQDHRELWIIMGAPLFLDLL